MTTPSPDDRPTTVLPQATVEQPTVTTAPSTRRGGRWGNRLPARIGRARTSTVVIGCLFVLLFALNSALPRDEGASVPVVLPSGQTAYVNESDLPSGAVPSTTAPAPASSTPAPAPTSTPATTSRAPQSSSTPSATPSQSTRAPSSSSTPSTTSRAPSSTSRAPSTSAEPSASEEQSEETSSAPTS